MVVWRKAQILTKRDLSLSAGATKPGLAHFASAYCMLAKQIFMHSKWKKWEEMHKFNT